MKRIFTLLSIEARKHRGRLQSFLLLAPAAMTIIWTMQKLDKNDDVWGILLFQGPCMNAVFLPVFIALFASRLIDIEHRGGTWKLLYTFARPKTIFFVKFLYGSIMIFSVLFMQTIALLLAGSYKTPGLPVPFAALS